jgi:hypothetical protein
MCAVHYRVTGSGGSVPGNLEINNNIDPENEVSYGTSSKGKEVMIVNDREIFHEKYSGKRLIYNIFKI